MGTPFLSEIRIVAFNFPPKGWTFCNGQLMSIQQNTALFSLIGTFYGGNGTTNFQLPNLQGQVPLMYGTSFSGASYNIGEVGGEVNHTLLATEMPAHVHTMQGSNTAGTTGTPTNATLAQPSSAIANTYVPSGTNSTTMAPQAIANAGGSQPHSNQQPYLVLNFAIALIGIFPSRT
jgi:microcystin-dependent protein